MEITHYFVYHAQMAPAGAQRRAFEVPLSELGALRKVNTWNGGTSGFKYWVDRVNTGERGHG